MAKKSVDYSERPLWDTALDSQDRLAFNAWQIAPHCWLAFGLFVFCLNKAKHETN